MSYMPHSAGPWSSFKYSFGHGSDLIWHVRYLLRTMFWIQNYFLDPDPGSNFPFGSGSASGSYLTWPNPVPDPTLQIHFFTMPTIFKVFLWLLKHTFQRKVRLMYIWFHNDQIANFFMILLNPQSTKQSIVSAKSSNFP
jgi:hypothetical protein